MAKPYSAAELHGLQDFTEEEVSRAADTLLGKMKALVAAGKTPAEALDLAAKAAEAELIVAIGKSVKGGMTGRAP